MSRATFEEAEAALALARGYRIAYAACEMLREHLDEAEDLLIQGGREHEAGRLGTIRSAAEHWSRERMAGLEGVEQAERVAATKVRESYLEQRCQDCDEDGWFHPDDHEFRPARPPLAPLPPESR